MKVKICGMTTFNDALAAAESGADMVGFNFYPKSPRYITPMACASLMLRFCDQGFSTVAVGIFVNEPVESVWEIMDMCGLQLAQLHGDESPNELMELGNRAYKAIRPRTLAEATTLLKQFEGSRTSEPSLLLDTHKMGHYGGTGLRADWKIASELARLTPLMLAGGLKPENVTAALVIVKPWGVDVCSGVEASPGKKDRKKVEAFIHAVREFETENEA